MNQQQINYVQDSFLLYGICTNPDCQMGLSPFVTTEYTRCPICDEPTVLPYSLSPILPSKEGARNIFKRYFPEFVSNLFEGDLVTGNTIGNTALSKNKKISEWIGIKNLYFKEEGSNPSGSFKDRGSFMAIALLRAYTKKLSMSSDFIFGTVSTGNMAISTAFFANKTRHNSFIVVSNKLSSKKLEAIQRAGGKNKTTVFVVDGEYQNIHDIVYRACSSLRKNNIPIFAQLTDDVFRISGYATLFAEIIEELLEKKSFPDVIILPIASGALFRAAIWSVESLFAKGYIKKVPRIVLVQEIGGDPIMHAVRNQLPKIEKISIAPTTIASAISVGYSRSGNPILSVLEEGYHKGIAVETNEIKEAKKVLHEQNYFAEEASCAAVAAAKKLTALGEISKDDRVVCILTGQDVHYRSLPSVNNSHLVYSSLEEFESVFLNIYGRRINK